MDPELFQKITAPPISTPSPNTCKNDVSATLQNTRKPKIRTGPPTTVGLTTCNLTSSFNIAIEDKNNSEQQT
jgi:hypothetical protein